MSTDIEIRRDPVNCAGQNPELLLRMFRKMLEAREF